MPAPIVYLAGATVVAAAKWFFSSRLAGALTGVAVAAAVVVGMQDWYCVILLQMMTWGTGFFEWLARAMPDGMQDYVAAASDAYPVINCWFPLGFAFKCFSVYSLFAFCVIAYRTIKSWIPSVSG